MKIAYTKSPGRGDTDLLLAGLADFLREQGVRVAGAVQINCAREDNRPCDMDVRVLPDGPVIRISQSLGKDGRGCRLDPHALETAVGLVEASFANGADVLIINKFGKHEAQGRGFRSPIAEALARDIPVLVGTNRLNEPAFLEFSGGLATELAPCSQAILQWLEVGGLNPVNARIGGKFKVPVDAMHPADLPQMSGYLFERAGHAPACVAHGHRGEETASRLSSAESIRHGY